MNLNRVPLRPQPRDHKPLQIGNASDGIDAAGFTLSPNIADIEFERNFFLSLGWPFSVVQELEQNARTAKVGLIQAAIASGALNAPEFYDRLSRFLSFANGREHYRVHLPGAPSAVWLLLERPVPLAAGDAGVVALNGQSFSIPRLIALSRMLGARRRHLKLVTRQDLIDAVTRSYGRVLVARAVAGLMKERPQWSAKSGLAPWQRYFGAICAGLATGAVAFAPEEVLTLAALLFSLFFLFAMALRLAAILSVVFPDVNHAPPPLLTDAELPRYTVFVPLFKEVEILPHLAEALARLDYPGIMAQTPEGNHRSLLAFGKAARDGGPRGGRLLQRFFPDNNMYWIVVWYPLYRVGIFDAGCDVHPYERGT
jgi:glycosyltransferase XagB